jgi:hypothetical protein
MNKFNFFIKLRKWIFKTLVVPHCDCCVCSVMCVASASRFHIFSYVILGQLYGLEKFWAFLKYYRHSSKLHIDPKLKEFLSGYNDVKDFRVVMASLHFF